MKRNKFSLWYFLAVLPFLGKSKEGEQEQKQKGSTKMSNIIYDPRIIDNTSLSTRFDEKKLMPIEKVDTIVVHQTDMADKNGNPAIKDRPEVWAKIKSGIGVDATGHVYRNVDSLLRDTQSSNGWNGRSVAIETDGAYFGIENDERTFRRSVTDKQGRTFVRAPTKITQGTKDGLRLAIKYICDEIARLGGKIKYVVSHRQSSENRVSDPGEAIWQVVKEVAAEQGLDTRIDTFKGTGYPIPRQWDARSIHDYFDYKTGKRT